MNTITCQWYARCARPARGVVLHPVLDAVPTCGACADKHSLRLLAPVDALDLDMLAQLSGGDGWKYWSDGEFRRDRAEVCAADRDLLRSMVAISPRRG